MALKNWKAERHSHLKGEVAFWRNNVDYNNGLVTIFEVEEGAPDWEEGKFQVSTDAGFDLETKYFKTKQKAFKFAKNFMRSH